IAEVRSVQKGIGTPARDKMLSTVTLPKSDKFRSTIALFGAVADSLNFSIVSILALNFVLLLHRKIRVKRHQDLSHLYLVSKVSCYIICCSQIGSHSSIMKYMYLFTVFIFEKHVEQGSVRYAARMA